MDDYGLITIDNRNLLDDLLGLSEQDENPTQLNRQQFDYTRSKIPANKYPEARKVYLESPTFTKKEDDIYRYVHSRLSSVEQPTTSNRILNDQSIGANENFSNEKASNKTRNVPLISQTLNRNNRLQSDIAVASLPKNTKNARSGLEEPFYENDLLDSLDNNNNYYNLNNYQNGNLYENNISDQNTNLNYQAHTNNSNNNNQQFSQQAFLLDNQAQQNYYHHQQQQQLQLQQQILQQQQQIQLLPFQTNQPKQQQQVIPPTSVFTTILPSPTSNLNNPNIPLVQSSLQFQPTPPQVAQFYPLPMQPTQFMPSQTHPHPHQNMFIQEQMQPMYFNQAYPINLAGSLQNSNNFFNHQQNDYDHYQFQQPNEFYSNNQYMNNLNSNKYDAQPLQPPKMVTPRLNNNNNNNNNINATKNNSNKKNIDYDSPDSDDNVDQELTNEFTTLKVIDKNSNKNNNNNNNNNNDTSDEDLKRQEVWNKLQNANRKETKSNGSQSKMNGLPPVVSSKSVIKQQQQQHQQQKPSQSVMEQKRMEANFLEKNVEAIKNKENLTHRYPEKKYEAFYGKNMGARVKNFQNGDQKQKPPHQLQPIENNNYENEESYKTISLDINGHEDLYSSKKITIPIKPDLLRDKDHINLDINLRLVDFLPNATQNSNRNRSFDDFEVDPLNQHIKRFESMSRSLPGSSGSLNKLKPLPPVNRRTTNLNNNNNNNNHLSDTRMHDHDNEEGYLAQLQKSHNRPVIKTYTLKDYRNFKKDAIPGSSTNTGKLGPDFENEQYKLKAEITQKKIDYAERVKARNRLLLAEQNKKNDEDESIKSISNQSKTQRAKDYARNNVTRPKSSSRPISNELENDDTLKSSQVKSLASDRSTIIRKHIKSENERSINKHIVRIRDPVTSKIRTVFLNDNQLIDELSIRHENDKNKVKNILNNNNSNNDNESSRSKMDSSNDLNNNALNNRNLLNNQNNNNSNNGIIIRNSKMPVDLKIGKSTIMEEYDKQKAEDEEFEKLMERHNAEKNKVNQFEASPYLQENLINNIENQEIQVE